MFEHEGWRLKVYGIAYDAQRPRAELVEAARDAARAVLPLPARAPGRYGVGFLGVHDGRGHGFAFVDWWAEENELHHHVFVAPAHRPLDLQEVTASGLSACVWDLAVISFERDAWVEHVLSRSGGPDLDRYLAVQLEADV